MNGKNKTCLLRLTEHDVTSLSIKANLLNTDKSKLFRDGAYAYWNQSPLPQGEGFAQPRQPGA